MFAWFKKYFPDTYEFIRNFFKALNNKNEGHSLRKWLAVGFFWLTAVVVLRFTDASNLVAVISVLSGMITTLIVTYSVSNYKEKQIKNKPEDSITDAINPQG